MKKGKVFTLNDAIAMMHRDGALCLNETANHIEKHKDDYTVDEVIRLLREIADEKDAQAMVVDLRDTL